MAEAGKAGSESLDELIEKALSSKEPLQKPESEPIRPQTLLERIVLSQSTSVVSGVALSALWYQYLAAMFYKTPQTVEAIDKFTQLPIPFGLGFLAAHLIKQDWLFRKAEAAQRSLMKPLPKILSSMLDHAALAGGLAAAGITTSYLISPGLASVTPSHITESLDALLPLLLPLLGITTSIASTAFSAAYSAWSLAFGRFFTAETLKTLFNASVAAINSYGEKYDKAVNNLAKLLSMPRSYEKTVTLHSLIGDLQGLSESTACLDSYFNAASSDKTAYVGRSDWVLRPFVWLIKQVLQSKIKKLPQGEPNEYTYLIKGVHAFAEGKIQDITLADASMQTAVRIGRENFPIHAIRSAFLRRIGRHYTAGLEMKICAELLMKSQDIEFERVEGSRNEVFFAGNVALKRNTDPSPLEEELAVITKFRERFGQSVIYPLPVYKRDGFYYLLSEKDTSETLLGLIRQKKARFEDFAQAIQLLVQLQKFGLGLYKAGELPLDDRILQIDTLRPKTMYFASRRMQAMKQIERFNGVKLPESYKAAVGHGLAFIDKVLASSPFLTMYKDFNPKNVLKRLFGRMQVLDFEPRSLKLLPPQTDLVNLLEFTEYLSPEHIRRLLDLAADMFAKENRVKIDKKEFTKAYEFAAFQWHYERLIYRPEESVAARTEEQREAKKKEQLYHLAKAREHLGTIITREYAKGQDLASAKLARRELEYQIFAHDGEQRRLAEIVESEKRGKTLHEPLPMSKVKLAAASSAVPIVLAVSILGGVAITNNLIPFLNLPVFHQGDKVILEEIKPGNKQFNYHVINAKSDSLSFLFTGEKLASANLSVFKDKFVFLNENRLLLYDFISGEVRTAAEGIYSDPVISPNGLWIAASREAKGLKEREIVLVRPSDMMDVKLEMPFSFSPVWSDDSSRIAFFSHGVFSGNRFYFDPDLRLYIAQLSSDKPHDSQVIGEGTYRFSKLPVAWSSDNRIAYASKLGDKPVAIYISDPKFKNPKQVYTAESSAQEIEDIKFVGLDHLLVQYFQKHSGKPTVALLNLENFELIRLESALLGAHPSKDGSRVLYICNSPFDVCEFNLANGQSRNLTNTPEIWEENPVYSANGEKVYVVGYSHTSKSSTPSLHVIDLTAGKSKLLRQSQIDGEKYLLITP